jgi:serine/threonine protein kinase
MPSHPTLSLAEALQHLPLLAPRQQSELACLQDRFPDPRALAGELIRLDWLTPYQANQIFRGRAHELVLGSYLLLERLGEGGMGMVFKARHVKMGRVAAVKVIRKERLRKANAVRRFHREVRAAAQLDHPNVVHAYDAGQAGDTHYFVMEYVEGTDLNKLVQKGGPLPIAEACDCIRQAALGLQRAHEKGLVHRDVKPHNLIRTARGQVKLLDVGLVRVLESCADPEVTMTREGAVLGTVDFLAPEQAADPHAVDLRADLYSLGCTFYYLLTGQIPFPAHSSVEKLLKHQREEPPPLERVRPGIPPGIVAVVRRLMAKRPENRYQTAAEVAAVLQALPETATSCVREPPRPVSDAEHETVAEGD